MTGPFFRFGIGLTDDEHKDLVAFLRVFMILSRVAQRAIRIGRAVIGAATGVPSRRIAQRGGRTGHPLDLRRIGEASAVAVIVLCFRHDTNNRPDAFARQPVSLNNRRRSEINTSSHHARQWQIV